MRLKKILSIIICGRLLFLEYQKQRKGLLRLLPTNIAGHARQVKEDDDERIGEKRFPYPFFGIYVEQFLEGATVSDKFSTFICYDEEKYADEVKENEKTTSKKCSTNRKCK